MKKMYLFRLVGEDIEDDINESGKFNHPFFRELDDIIVDEDTKYMGFSKNDSDIFMSLEDSKIERITTVFVKYFIINRTDVTEKVMNGEIQLEYPEVDKKFFEQFRLDNTTLDDVLDKINKFGIESLDHIDRTILGS